MISGKTGADEIKLYVLLDGMRFGPYSKAEVEEYMEEGQINHHTSVQEVGTARWVPLHTIPGFEFRTPLPAPGPTPAILSNRELQKMMESVGDKDPRRRASVQEKVDPAVHNDRNPILTAVFSLIIPGAGQLYNRDWLKGVFMLATTVGLVFFLSKFAWLPLALWSSWDAYIGAIEPTGKW